MCFTQEPFLCHLGNLGHVLEWKARGWWPQFWQDGTKKLDNFQVRYTQAFNLHKELLDIFWNTVEFIFYISYINEWQVHKVSLPYLHTYLSARPSHPELKRKFLRSSAQTLRSKVGAKLNLFKSVLILNISLLTKGVENMQR